MEREILNEGRLLGANVILESTEGVTMQLRDDVHRWGIFGGLVDDAEDPKQTAVREIREELGIKLDPERLDLLKVFEGPRYTTHLFHYQVGNELEDAVLSEGIRFEAKSREGLSPDDVVPWHWMMLEWYWDQIC